MKWRFSLVALAAALATASAAAQETRYYPLIGEARLSADGKTLTSAGELVRERYEEIEIMARLLDRGLGKLSGLGFHGGVSSVAFSPDGTILGTASDGGLTGSVRLWDVATGRQLGPHAAVEFPNMQGVYLKGQGIVFTATIPQHFQKAVGGANKPAPKVLTPWERVRKELRGEKVEAEKAKQTDDTSIADAVLKVLAENGKNLTRLPEAENVTVALTLLPAQTCVNCHAGIHGAGGGMMGGMMGSGSGGMMSSGMGGMMGLSGGMGAGRAGGSGASSSQGSHGVGSGSSSGSFGSSSGSGGTSPNFAANLAEFRKNALMGDLALKQKDYQQAVNAYSKAIGIKGLPEDSATALEKVEVATKLARALLAQGKIAEAENAVKAVTRAAERIKGGVHANKPAEKKADVALPAKLIITVPKKYLDQVGTGRIDFNALRKEAASVEYLTFDKPAAEKPRGGGVGP